MIYLSDAIWLHHTSEVGWGIGIVNLLLGFENQIDGMNKWFVESKVFFLIKKNLIKHIKRIYIETKNI